MRSASRAFQEQRIRANPNIERCRGLIELAKNMKQAGGPSGTAADDVLRAAVVLMHATLEDFLRYVACRYLSKANTATLNALPIKVPLGTLSKKCEQSVKSVIREAIVSHFNTENFNKTAQLDKLFGYLGMEEAALYLLRSRYPSLRELMDRRHRIVHEADLHEGDLTERRKLREITVEKVHEWWSTVDKFIKELGIHVIIRKHYK